MTKTGRPSFSIRPDRLKALRVQAGLTQKALAWPVFGVETLDARVSDPRTAANSYQRVETTGKTSKQAARKIAEVLAQKLGQDPERTLASLCGGAPEAPPDRVQEIENRLREQFRSGSNKALTSELQRYRQGDQPDEDDVCIEELARRIAFQLETAQLEQRREKLAKLAELTGWTVDELLRPNSLHGHWLLITNTDGYRETQILLGVSELLRQLETEGAKWLGMGSESDSRVQLSEDAPWFRVTLSRPHQRFPKEFSFVRCSPSATGLQWVKPSEWDRWTLHGDQWRASALVNWAFQHASFVKGFKADDMWPSDVRRLRLLVQQWVKPENPESAEDKDWWRTVAIHKGWLDEDPVFQSERRERFRAEGQEHTAVTNWLASGLWGDVLAPLLSPIPAAWWHMESWGFGVRIRTEMITLSQAAGYGLENEGRAYTIRLVEERGPGELCPAPWRQADVQALAERLRKDLEACQEQVSIGPQRSSWLTTA